MSATIDGLFRDVLGRGAWSDEQARYDAQVAFGRSLADIRQELAYSGEARSDVAAAFRDELGREATGGDLAAWQGWFAQGTTNFAKMRLDFAYTSEAAGLIAGVYAQGLGRSATDGEMSFWRDQLAGGSSVANVRSVMLHSSLEAAAVGGVYQDVLGRAAGAGDVLWWEDHVLMAGQSLADVRRALAYSDEARADVAAAFHDELGREATGGDFGFWQGFLAQGTATIATIRASFAHLPEAVAHLDGVYRQGLGRAATDAEVSFWQDRLAGGSSVDDVRSVMLHSAAEAAAVGGVYQDVLGRAAGAGDVLWWEDHVLMAGQSLADVRRAVAFSNEARTNVAAAFHDELGREATGGDFAAWQESLARGTATFATIRLSFAHTPEATSVLAGVSQQLLGRAPDAGFLAWAEAALAHGTSIDALRNLVAHSTEGAQKAAIDGFYQRLFQCDAPADQRATILAAVGPGQTLQQVLDGLVSPFVASPYEAQVIDGFYQERWGRAATAGEMASARAALSRGRSLADVEQSVVRLVADVDGFYQQLFLRNAHADEVTSIQAAVDAGQTLQQAFEYLRPLFAHTPFEVALLDNFCRQALGRPATASELAAAQAALAAGTDRRIVEQRLLVPQNADALYQQLFGRNAVASEVATIQAAVDAGQTVREVMAFLRREFAYSSAEDGMLAAAYAETTGGTIGADDLPAAEDALYGGASLAEVRSAFAHSDAANQVVGGIYLDVFGRDATTAEIASVEAGLSRIGGGSVSGLRAGLAGSGEAGDRIDRFYTEILGRHADAGGMATWRAALASGTTLGDVRWGVAHSAEAAGLVRSAVQTATGLAADASTLAMIEAALAAGASLDSITPGLGGIVYQDVTRDGQGEVAGFLYGQHPSLVGRRAAEGFYATVLGRAPTMDERVGVAAAFSSGLSGSTLVTARDQTGAVLGQTTAERLLVELPVFLAMTGGLAPVLSWVGSDGVADQLAGDGTIIAAFLLGLEGRAGRLNPKVLAIYAEVGAWMDQIGQQLLQLAWTMTQAVPGTSNLDQKAIEQEVAKLATLLAAKPAPERLQGLTERITLGTHKADVTVFRDPATGDWTFKVHDISNPLDLGQIAIQLVALVASAVLLVVSAGSAAPGVGALLAGEFTVGSVAAGVAIASDLVLAGQSFANGDVLGGLLSLAAATGVGVAGLGNSATLGLTAAETAKLGGLILAARGVVGGVASSIQSAERGNGFGVAAGILQVAAAGAAGILADAPPLPAAGSVSDAAREAAEASRTALVNATKFLSGVATAAGVADAFAHNNIQAGIFASLNGVLNAFAARISGRARDRPFKPLPKATRLFLRWKFDPSNLQRAVKNLLQLTVRLQSFECFQDNILAKHWKPSIVTHERAYQPLERHGSSLLSQGFVNE